LEIRSGHVSVVVPEKSAVEGGDVSDESRAEKHRACHDFLKPAGAGSCRPGYRLSRHGRNTILQARIILQTRIEDDLVGKPSGKDGSLISLDSAPITPAFISASEIRFTTPKHDNGYAGITAQRGAAVAYTEFLYVPPALRDLPPGAITTVAGIGSYYGDGRQATAAVLAVMNLVTDAAGNIYVEEPGPGRVRRIRPDGVIEPFIGTGVEGPDGDGGPALKAKLWFPRGIALDAAGNIYIGDYSQRVRRVDARTGIITTIAGTGVRGFSGDGGPALRAQFDFVRRCGEDPSPHGTSH
jgi:hypothetical protein